MKLFTTVSYAQLLLNSFTIYFFIVVNTIIYEREKCKWYECFNVTAAIANQHSKMPSNELSLEYIFRPSKREQNNYVLKVYLQVVSESTVNRLKIFI